VTTVHDVGGVLGRASDTFLLGSHNVMVTALGSRVKWPLLLCESGGEYSGRLKPLTASVAGDEAADCALRPFPSARWQGHVCVVTLPTSPNFKPNFLVHSDGSLHSQHCLPF
jgi:hypothetical protein